MACRYSSGVRISSPSELPSDSNIFGHLPLKQTDVMFRHSCSLYEKQWRAVYNIASTRTTPQEKVLFIDMCTSEVRYRHPWLNSSVQHRVECIFAGTGASALRKSWAKLRSKQQFRVAEIYPRCRIAANLASCLLISIHWTCLTSVWRAGSLDFWTGIQVIRWVVYLTIIKCFRLLYIATILY